MPVIDETEQPESNFVRDFTPVQLPEIQETSEDQRVTGNIVWEKGSTPVIDETIPSIEKTFTEDPFSDEKEPEPEIEDSEDDATPDMINFFRTKEEKVDDLVFEKALQRAQASKKGTISTIAGEIDIETGQRVQNDETLGSAVGSIGMAATKAFGDIPIRGVIGGIRDAVQKTINLGTEIREALGIESLIGELGEDATKEEEAIFNALKALEQKNLKVPEVPQPRTGFGDVVRDISQFLASFATAGKFLKGIKFTGKIGALAKPAIQGAIADFVGGPEGILESMVEKNPELKGPIDNFLSEPDNPEIRGRLVSSLEGILFGLGTEVFLRGLKQFGKIKSQKSILAQKAEASKFRITKEDFAPLGDISENAPLIENINKKIKEAIKETKGKVGKITKKLDEGVEVPTETGPRGGGGRIKVGDDEFFVNYARFDTEDDIKQVIKVIADEFGKKSKVTLDEISLDADQVNAFEALFNRRTGTLPAKAEQVAIRRLWAGSAAKLSELYKNISRQQDPSETEVFMFRKMLATHALIQNEVTGIRTELARALASWRIPVGSGEEMARAMEDILQANGGKEVSIEMANKLNSLMDSGLNKEIEDIIRRGAGARTLDAFMQAWVAGLLTGPKTHGANMISNTSFVGLTVAERSTAIKIGQLIGDGAGTELGEDVALMVGQIEGLKAALRISWKGTQALGLAGEKAIKRDFAGAKEVLGANSDEFGSVWKAAVSGKPQTTGTKIDLPRGRGFEEAAQIYDSTWLGKFVGGVEKVTGIDKGSIKKKVSTAGKITDLVTTMPFRFLTTEDELFKSVGYHMELSAQAHRQAVKEVRDGAIKKEDFKKRVLDIIKDPPKEIKLESVNAALYQTFTDRPSFYAKLAQKLQQKNPLWRIPFTFINVADRIFVRSQERTPWAPLMKHVRQEIGAGGARREIALARMAMGTGIMMVATDLALSNRITGSGPSNPLDRDKWLRMGYEPYSVMIGEEGNFRSFAYNRAFEPLGMVIGMAADMAEMSLNADWSDDFSDDFEHAMFVTIASIANNTMSKMFVRGMAELVDALSDPVRKGEGYFRRLATSVIPTGLKEAARYIDPYVRESNNLIESLKSKIPFFSKDLAIGVDRWGRPRTYLSDLGSLYDAASPIYSSKIAPQPIDVELKRLEMNLAMPNDVVNYDGIGINLKKDRKAFNRYVQLIGRDARIPVSGKDGEMEFFNKLVTGKHQLSIIYNLRTDGPDGTKAQYLRYWDMKFKKKAKNQLLREFPHLLEELNEKRQQEGLSPKFIF